MSSRPQLTHSKEVVSRLAVLKWINGLLHLELTSINELASGACFCYIFEMIHPGSIPICKVNGQAKNQHRFTCNFKLLQEAFAKQKITYPLNSLRLTEPKSAGIYQLAVWLKKHYQQHYEETKSTMSTLASIPDFNFAHKKVVRKNVSRLSQREVDSPCKYCCPSETQESLMKGISILSVKLQMIRQVLDSEQDSQDKLAMIEELVSLEYDKLKCS